MILIWTDVENGRNVSSLYSKRSSIDHMARRCILLFVLFMVRRQSWHTIETKRNAKHINRNHHQATGGARHTVRWILSVSEQNGVQRRTAFYIIEENLSIWRWLIETCFPKSNNKIKCYELFSMYVGLTSAHTLLDFNRRLVTILRDNITGFCGNDTGSS